MVVLLMFCKVATRRESNTGNLVKVPVTFIFPATLNRVVGFVVPIPTLPFVLFTVICAGLTSKVLCDEGFPMAEVITEKTPTDAKIDNSGDQHTLCQSLSAADVRDVQVMPS